MCVCVCFTSQASKRIGCRRGGLQMLGKGPNVKIQDAYLIYEKTSCQPSWHIVSLDVIASWQNANRERTQARTQSIFFEMRREAHRWGHVSFM